MNLVRTPKSVEFDNGIGDSQSGDGWLRMMVK